MFLFRSLSRRFRDRYAIARYTIDLGDGQPIPMSTLYEHNPDMIVERVGGRRRTCWPIVVAIAVALTVLALALFPILAHAQDVCNHHVTSGLVNHLIRRGMAKAFFFGELPSEALYGMLVVWNPSCQRAIVVVLRTGPRGEVFNFVTHYYVSGSKGGNISSAIQYARQQVASRTVWMRSAPPSMAFRFVPRSPDSPGFRPPIRDGGGGGGGGGGGPVGGIRRDERD